MDIFYRYGLNRLNIIKVPSYNGVFRGQKIFCYYLFLRDMHMARILILVLEVPLPID